MRGMPGSPNLLSVRNLSVELASRGPVVADVCFDIGAGTVTGLVGESGCGKTTLALALMGLLPGGRYRVKGEVWLEDRELLSLREREMERLRGARIAMIFQDP